MRDPIMHITYMMGVLKMNLIVGKTHRWRPGHIYGATKKGWGSNIRVKMEGSPHDFYVTPERYTQIFEEWFSATRSHEWRIPESTEPLEDGEI